MHFRVAEMYSSSGGDAVAQPATGRLELIFRIPSLIFANKKSTHSGAFLLAERKGFEPLRRYQRLHDFQSCAFDQLSHLSRPTSGCRSHRRPRYHTRFRQKCQAFLQKTCAFLSEKRRLCAQIFYAIIVFFKTYIPIVRAMYRRMPGFPRTALISAPLKTLRSPSRAIRFLKTRKHTRPPRARSIMPME